MAIAKNKVLGCNKKIVVYWGEGEALVGELSLVGKGMSKFLVSRGIRFLIRF